jgi:hypothetical protein
VAIVADLAAHSCWQIAKRSGGKKTTPTLPAVVEEDVKNGDIAGNIVGGG